jgi:hypothetical protein
VSVKLLTFPVFKKLLFNKVLPTGPPSKKYYSKGYKEVIELSQQLYKGIVLSRDSNQSEEIIAETVALLKENEVVIHNATLSFNHCLARIDTLVKKGSTISVILVKPALKISANYFLEAAFNVYILRGCGYNIKQVSILSINKHYVLQEEIDPASFFSIRNITEAINDSVTDINEKIESVLSLEDSINIKEAEIIVDKGLAEVTRLMNSDVLGLFPGLRTDSFEVENLFELRQFLNSIEYPIGLLDIETFMPPIPVIKGTTPFHHLPFHYSLHRLENKNSAVSHIQFLSPFSAIGIKALQDSLALELKVVQTILAFDSATEKKILNSLTTYQANSDYNICDLSIPFQNGWIKFKDSADSYSLKNIMTVLLGENVYEKLPVQNGRDAMNAYECWLYETDLDKKQVIYGELCTYGKLDSFALIIIYKWLSSL